MIQKIHHIGVAVRSLKEALGFYADVMGLPVQQQAEIPDQGMKAALLTIGGSEIELLEPLSPESPVGRFLERHGEGLHHICLQVADIDEELAGLKDRGVALIDQEPRRGLAGMICFLDPRASHGVLVELARPME